MPGEAPALVYRERKKNVSGPPVIDQIKEVLKALYPFTDEAKALGEKVKKKEKISEQLV